MNITYMRYYKYITTPVNVISNHTIHNNGKTPIFNQKLHDRNLAIAIPKEDNLTDVTL